MGALLLGVVFTAGFDAGFGVEAVVGFGRGADAVELTTGGLGFGAEELVVLLTAGVVVAAMTAGLAGVAGPVPEGPEMMLSRHQRPLLLSLAQRST